MPRRPHLGQGSESGLQWMTYIHDGSVPRDGAPLPKRLVGGEGPRQLKPALYSGSLSIAILFQVSQYRCPAVDGPFELVFLARIVRVVF